MLLTLKINNSSKKALKNNIKKLDMKDLKER